MPRPFWGPHQKQLLKLAWVPLFSGMTVNGGRRLAAQLDVIPAQAGTHASLRTYDGSTNS